MPPPQFKHGQCHGVGTQWLVPEGQRGVPDRLHVGGMGSLYRPTRYEGEWRDGRRCGLCPSGTRGLTLEPLIPLSSLRHGWGKLVFADGTSYAGLFHDGRLDGLGRILFASGRERGGLFKDSARQRYLEEDELGELEELERRHRARKNAAAGNIVALLRQQKEGTEALARRA